MAKLSIFSWVLVLLTTWPIFSQVNFAETNQRTTELIKSYVSHANVPGLAITISINDSVVYTRGFGYANLEMKTPVDPAKTRFRIASITKTMTAATIGRLAELGKIELKKSPHFYLDSLSKKKHDFSIEQVGSHLAGLKRDASTEKFTCDNPYSRKDFYRIFSTDKLLFEPSTNFEYSNYGYRLLGILIEKITGQSIIESHRKYVIDKIGLKNTFPETAIIDSLTATFYSSQNNKLIVAPCLSCDFRHASGCYLSTSEDLAILGNAYLFPDRLLKKETLTSLVKSKYLANGRKTNYGFGFAIHTDIFNHLYYGHTGGYANIARSSLAIYPQGKLVIAILVNRSVDDIDSLSAEITNNYIVELNKSKP